MNKREEIVKLWFAMWLQKTDLGIQDIFSDDAVYVESWGPEYHGCAKIKHWFEEWNTRGSVLVWEIKQFFHQENQTVTEWFFKNTMADGTVESFDGLTLIRWTQEDKICFLKEFGCNLNRYDPYENGAAPRFQGDKAMWF